CGTDHVLPTPSSGHGARAWDRVSADHGGEAHSPERAGRRRHGWSASPESRAFGRAHHSLDDPQGLQATALAQDRVHGTSMASIILHGDLSGQSPTIDSKIVVHPLLVPDPLSADSPRPEISPPDRLLLDVIHICVKRLVEGEGAQPPVAPSIRVVNLSI